MCVIENHFSYYSSKIGFGYSKELSQWDSSFEHPKHMFKLMVKEINAIIGTQTIHIWTYVVLTKKWTLTIICFEFQRRRRLTDNHQTTYNSNHTGFFPKVPLHASTINPSYHASSFPSTFSTHNTSNQLSLLPSISNTYKTHKVSVCLFLFFTSQSAIFQSCCTISCLPGLNGY